MLTASTRFLSSHWLANASPPLISAHAASMLQIHCLPRNPDVGTGNLAGPSPRNGDNQNKLGIPRKTLARSSRHLTAEARDKTAITS